MLTCSTAKGSTLTIVARYSAIGQCVFDAIRNSNCSFLYVYTNR